MRWEVRGKGVRRAAWPQTWSWSTWRRVHPPVSMGVIAAVLMSAAMALAASAAVEPLHALIGHTAGVNAIAFSPDGKTVATGAWDRTIRLWDAATGGEIGQLLGHLRSVHAVAFSPDGATLASGALSVKLWDLTTGKEIATLTGQRGAIMAVTFSPDGMTLASGSLDHSVKLWRLSPDNGWEIHATLDAHTHGVRSTAFSPDGSLLASAGQDSTIRLWDVATGSTVRVLGEETHGFYCSVAFSPDGSVLASGNADGSITLWDVNTGEAIRTIFRQGPQNWNGHTASALSIAFSPDGRLLASGSQDRTIKLWEVETGSILQTLTEHGNTVDSVAFSPDGRRLASASSDQTARLWDLQGVLPAAHAITDIRFDPPSPATLEFDQRVDVSFVYATSAQSGARIYVYPMVGGRHAPGASYSGFRYDYAPTGAAGSGHFTIRQAPGTPTVDQVLLRMTENGKVVFETSVDVLYSFGEVPPQHAITDIRFDPPSPATLEFGQRVNYTFSYSTDDPRGVRIVGRPLVQGIVASGIAVNHPVDYPTGHGSGSLFFSVREGEQTVDQVRLTMYAAGTNTVLAQIDVDVHFECRSKPADTCAIFVQPGASIQAAIDAAAEGAVICLAEGEWEENLSVTKSLSLRGVGAVETVIKGLQPGLPVVRIESDEEIEVAIVGLTVAEAREGDPYEEDGIRVGGHARVTITDVTVVRNGRAGVFASHTARIAITGCTIGENHIGVSVWRAAEVTIADSAIAGKGGGGVLIGDYGKVTITGTSIVGSSSNGITVWQMAEATIAESTVAGHEGCGIFVLGQITITGSTVVGNGAHGIELWSLARATIEANDILDNGGLGIALYERPCYDIDRVFFGRVTGRGNSGSGVPGDDYCPDALAFLFTEEGGELDRWR